MAIPLEQIAAPRVLTARGRGFVLVVAPAYVCDRRAFDRPQTLG